MSARPAAKASFPLPADIPTFARARRVLAKLPRLSEADASFVRAAAAIAMERRPTLEQSARLLHIAQRVGAEP